MSSLGVPLRLSQFGLTLAILFSTGCGGHYLADVPDPPTHLYSYRTSELEKLFRRKGFQGEIIWIRPNPSATALWAHRLENGYIGTLFISTPGSSNLKEVFRHGDEVWHNDEGDVVAWLEKSKGLVHLKDGNELSVPKGSAFKADEFGQYFVLSTADEVKLFANADFKTPLAKLQNRPSDIWSRGNYLYACSSNPPDGELCRVYSLRGTDLNYEREFEIPGWIIQLDPWSDWAITQKPHDFFPPTYYLVNLRTAYSAKLSRRGFEQPMFLANDLLKFERARKSG